VLPLSNNYGLIFTRICQKLKNPPLSKKCDIFLLTLETAMLALYIGLRVSREISGFHSIYFCKSDSGELNPPFQIIALFWIKPSNVDQVNLENTLTNISSNECTNNFKWN